MTSHQPQRETIRYTFATLGIGGAMVAATERGICALMLGENEAMLLGEMRGDFSHATLTRDDHALAPALDAIQDYFAGNTVPTLDPHGTPFQLRVWAALCAIPRGQTRSYSQLARAIGQPTAVRAVGHACASNKIAILIPCHRALRADGSLAGFRWGLDHKQQLIDIERGNAPLYPAAVSRV